MSGAEKRLEELRTWQEVKRVGASWRDETSEDGSHWGELRRAGTSVSSGISTVEFLIAFSVQSRASSSGILVNSDFTSKDTSLWSSGICIVLMASIKFSVDCS